MWGNEGRGWSGNGENRKVMGRREESIGPGKGSDLAAVANSLPRVDPLSQVNEDLWQL